MEQIFSIGDSVVMRTGSSPKIILDDKLGEDESGRNFFDGTYQCAWYDDNHDIQIEIIPQAELLPARSSIVNF
jgi:uncharacterized protein YodC (DUF2158 family)